MTEQTARSSQTPLVAQTMPSVFLLKIATITKKVQGDGWKADGARFKSALALLSLSQLWQGFLEFAVFLFCPLQLMKY